MVDRIKELPQRLLEWWNRFTSKQKTIIVCVAAGLIVAIAILATALTRPKYELLVTCESTKEASQIKDLLDGADLKYIISDDGYQISILKSQLSDANLLLGANDIPTASYGIENVTDGGFSTTESDKQKRYRLYLEKQMEEDLVRFDAVKRADVQLSIPENDGTLLSRDEQAFASVILELDGEFTQDNAAAMAQFVKTALGNDNAENITILDSLGNLLYSGDDSMSATGAAASQMSVKQQAERLLRNEVKRVLLATNQYNSVEVASNLNLDFSTQEITQHEYTPAAGQTQGVLSHEDIYSAENVNSSGGVPGTDSNSETTYEMLDSANSTSTVNEQSRDYLPNEKITYQTVTPGVVNYTNSSISVAAIRYDVRREEDVRSQGLLDGITWDQYKAANNTRTLLPVDDDIVNVVSAATGIPVANIALVAYEEPLFVDREGWGFTITDVIQIVLILIILILLGVVVFLSMRGQKQEEEEEELSVEDLLESAPVEEMTSISTEEKSEIRLLIEQFIEENPEAAATLLRNWLNEDWG